MGLSLDSTAAKPRVKDPLRLFVAYESEADVAGCFRDVLYPNSRYS
jgi:hypothetical protein